jgi:hypothetical protein
LVSLNKFHGEAIKLFGSQVIFEKQCVVVQNSHNLFRKFVPILLRLRGKAQSRASLVGVLKHGGGSSDIGLKFQTVRIAVIVPAAMLADASGHLEAPIVHQFCNRTSVLYVLRPSPCIVLLYLVADSDKAARNSFNHLFFAKALVNFAVADRRTIFVHAQDFIPAPAAHCLVGYINKCVSHGPAPYFRLFQMESATAALSYSLVPGLISHPQPSQT